MRDDEAERYELQAQRERQEQLGQALYQRKRPDAKPWAELDEDARTQWILIALDQQGAVDTADVHPDVHPVHPTQAADLGVSDSGPPDVHPDVHPDVPEQDEFDVAVVVFCRATGVDEADAENGAQLAVRNAIAGGQRVRALPMLIPLPEYLIERGFTDPVQVADVTPLRYVGGQGIRLHATAEPYQNAGMGRPRKRDQ